ncbi:hypothetical protein GCM10017764_35800 [Sphingobacterium griseoflavum]|uniref:Uncharacterized protein n=1 Tax=Sphingobacterium griseoflavum TaxID=1474952 RepID=A0ABQ3I320_9SPHI|nr:hypothetical protein GCM10017764_35800 [Sphingobacterium griseoflavum]
MRWIDTRERLPKIEQVYVISITKDTYTYKSVAFFEHDCWFYSIEGEKGNLITDRVNGWVEDLSVYVR